ncbi:MAG: hypothetical protein H6R10_183 [Rhodocyclaceae bacterium]|nr:hypothetical protein [Rhodocyclaceae bacterium]
MDTWTKWTEFLSCGLFALPPILGIGLDSFEAFAVTLGLMQILLIAVTMGAQTVSAPARDDGRSKHRQR